MNTLLSGAVLSAITFATVGAYPLVDNFISENHTNTNPPPIALPNELSAPIIDVVFVLDTTSSMGGMIETAKEKIWSIANTMSSAQQTPDIRIGLVGFRDRGDAYVTKLIDLSSDVDSVYAALMDFEAQGGGDGPESVNQALSEAVNKMSWSQSANAYQTVFLVGDAPPHMDYKNDTRYPKTIEQAKRRGIVINAIQCGKDHQTRRVWESIAKLGGGNFFQVEQAGNGIALNTPYDAEMAKLAAELDDTRLYYGTPEEKKRMDSKRAATDKLKAESSTSALARRGAFNSSASGRKNLLGDKELVDAVSSGSIALEDLAADSLPDAISELAPAAQLKKIESFAKKRDDIQVRLRQLAEERNKYLEAEVGKDSEAKESLDRKLYNTVREQAVDSGLEYRDGPVY